MLKAVFEINFVVHMITFLLLSFFYPQKSTVLPSQSKYFFKIQTERRVLFYTHRFKSLETGEYLHSDGTSRVYMGAVPSSSFSNGVPQDRKTWFMIYFNLL